ncbi:concanavalin A-like lectin/glucanase domain-containing protein [Crucibulum laeve]|uniref:Concanavalin A-like lectin/glucanase domain-containing protein n=1 Tax=Crucibulum laeve TaxID=68775 RepID=A0A5C3LJ87_9AGAR|nr:concanavalin A-like lectin/glucanase domain-containing protein [Crucibulum laeve]
MKSLLTSLFCLLCVSVCRVSAIYVPVREYAGTSFFDKWDFYGFYDNTTWGNVTYQDRANATSKRLTYINGAGNAIIKVDNTTNVAPATLIYRDSIRLTSQDTYGVGSLIIIDALHIPYGCSVWPSFWTLGVGKEWPLVGEIDIIEGINLKANNQVALHSTPGCFQAQGVIQSGQTIEGNCSTDAGCIVGETKPNSLGAGFAQAGGGVYAVQMDVAGVFIWFFSRPDIPDDIKNANPSSSVDTSKWGTSSAAYPATGCNITQFFGPQQLILVTTLCGGWAGEPGIYAQTCPGNCVADNIIGPGSPKYDNAFWEIRYIRTYLADGLQAPPAASTTIPPSSTMQGSGSSSPDTSSTGNVRPSSWAVLRSVPCSEFLMIVVGVGALMLL